MDWWRAGGSDASQDRLHGHDRAPCPGKRDGHHGGVAEGGSATGWRQEHAEGKTEGGQEAEGTLTVASRWTKSLLMGVVFAVTSGIVALSVSVLSEMATSAPAGSRPLLTAYAFQWWTSPSHPITKVLLRQRLAQYHAPDDQKREEIIYALVVNGISIGCWTFLASGLHWTLSRRTFGRRR